MDANRRADPAAGVDPHPTATGGDWRAQLHPQARARVADEILGSLTTIMISEPEQLNELRKVAVRFEETIYTQATNQSDYLRRIPLKLLPLEMQTQLAPGNAQVIPDQSNSEVKTTLLQAESPRPYSIPLEYLKEITDSFSNKRILGHGGFGVVYMGVRRNGEMIAVKKIMSSLLPGLQKQFESEVHHLTMLQHPNIVRCVGYCYEVQKECLEYDGKYVFAEKAEMLLCLEYMPNKSLDKYISDESSGLDWSTRYNIIKGICYGLCHLHEEIVKPIIHLDLKPANILLDDGMAPKITDFGLSRLLDQHQTICTSSRDGTLRLRNGEMRCRDHQGMYP